MKGRVYLLEDDSSICSLVKVALEMSGFEFKSFCNIASFYSAITYERPDVALLDIMLPDGSGLDVLKCIKQKYPFVVCIMLSALGKEEDKVNGLNLGADDYISKPFSILELTARINARLRGKMSPIISANGVTLNIETMCGEYNGQKLPLNKKEFELLKIFVENAGKVLSRDRLLTQIWGYEGGETRTLDNHVARLRKLGISIDTIFGVGYRFG